METRSEREGPRRIPAFLNFLRGMETEIPRCHILHGWRFLNFLRGMETPLG